MLIITENSIGYEDVNDKLRLADCLYAAYSLEETIYQLAKVNIVHTGMQIISDYREVVCNTIRLDVDELIVAIR